MKKIYLIIKREYKIQIRQKSFIITTLFAPLFLFLLLYCYSKFRNNGNNIYEIAILDNKSINNIQSQKNIKFIHINNISNKIHSYKYILKNNPDALLYNNFSKKNNYILYILNDIDNVSLLNIKFLLHKIIVYKEKKINLELKFIHKNISIYKMLIIIAMMYVVMMFIIIYSVKIMRSILEEKNSRIIEIIISSVKPYQLMVGKIIGNAIVALTQFILWISFFLLTLSIVISNKNNFLSKIIPEIDEIINTIYNKEYIYITLIFFIYFLGGYLIFSSIFSAIASSIEIDSDHQQYSIIASIILLISFYFGIYGFKNKSILILFLSIFPITSPIVMLSRMYNYIPLWQIVLSILVLILSIIKIIKLSSIIYSNNILLFNKKRN